MMEKYDYDLSPTPLQLECERLRKEAEMRKRMLGRMMGEYAELRDQLAEAQAKLAAVERDAKRYKAIRDKDFHVHKLFETYDCASSTANLESFFCLDDLDAAIDNAMREGE